MSVFLSDFVRFYCIDQDCKRGRAGDREVTALAVHIGRVYGVGKDIRSAALRPGAIFSEIQEVLSLEEFETLVPLKPPLEYNKTLLSWDNFYFVCEDALIERVANVVLDYYFMDEKITTKPAAICFSWKPAHPESI